MTIWTFLSWKLLNIYLLGLITEFKRKPPKIPKEKKLKDLYKPQKRKEIPLAVAETEWFAVETGENRAEKQVLLLNTSFF